MKTLMETPRTLLGKARAHLMTAEGIKQQSLKCWQLLEFGHKSSRDKHHGVCDRVWHLETQQRARSPYIYLPFQIAMT